MRKTSNKNNATKHHMARQKNKLSTALDESTKAAKKAKKGKAGIVAQMKKRGYIQIDKQEPILASNGDVSGFTTRKVWKNVGVENAKAHV